MPPRATSAHDACLSLYVQPRADGLSRRRLTCRLWNARLRRARSQPRRPGGDDRAARSSCSPSARRSRSSGSRRSARPSPWGYLDQPAFLNGGGGARDVAGAALRSSTRCSRSSASSAASASGPRYGPRTVDLDLLLYGRPRARRAGSRAFPIRASTSARSRSSRSPSSIRRSSSRGRGPVRQLLLRRYTHAP